MKCAICGNKDFSEESAIYARGELDDDDFYVIICPVCVKKFGLIEGQIEGYSI